MGGVVNVYTLSPLTYEGVRLTAEYGSGDSYRFRASSYYKLSPDLGMAVTGLLHPHGRLLRQSVYG